MTKDLSTIQKQAIDRQSKEIRARLEQRIETQARNLLSLHRIGGGNGEVSVSVKTAHTLLKAMGSLVAKMMLEEFAAEMMKTDEEQK